ncbi:MAG: hypothetical protein ACR2NN_07235 [Bryobacteraceae bacterium]
MTDLQLYIAVGFPTLAVLPSLTISLVQISGIREDMRELRREVNTKLDLLTGKICEFMTARKRSMERSREIARNACSQRNCVSGLE